MSLHATAFGIEGARGRNHNDCQWVMRTGQPMGIIPSLQGCSIFIKSDDCLKVTPLLLEQSAVSFWLLDTAKAKPTFFFG
jgi:hypothetical protein